MSAQSRAAEPALDVEFTQVLQDMIGDLSNAPEPIQIKLFADDPAMLEQLGHKVGDAIGKIDGVVDVQNGIENTISGPATNFQIDPIVAARMGFTPSEVSQDATAILDGVTTADPLIQNGRPYTIGVRWATSIALLWRRSRTPSSIAVQAAVPCPSARPVLPRCHAQITGA